MPADTSIVAVIDGDGNAFCSTPSDTSWDTPVVPGTGLAVSSRGAQSWAVRGHPSCLAPGKRPRLTPNPALALKDDKPLMTIGTPGGDVQIQAMTQVAINILCHGMDDQAAIEAPRFATYSFPSSFAPFEYFPGLLKLEGRIDADVGDALAHVHARGYVQRGVKPGNVLVDTQGQLKLGYFGSVATVGAAPSDGAEGDARYLAPECVRRGRQPRPGGKLRSRWLVFLRLWNSVVLRAGASSRTIGPRRTSTCSRSARPRTNSRRGRRSPPPGAAG